MINKNALKYRYKKYLLKKRMVSKPTFDDKNRKHAYDICISKILDKSSKIMSDNNVFYINDKDITIIFSNHLIKIVNDKVSYTVTITDKIFSSLYSEWKKRIKYEINKANSKFNTSSDAILNEFI